MATEFIVNAERVRAEEPAGMLVLDWLRLRRRLTGTKEGCKEGDCGACSVMVGTLGEDGAVHYEPVTSCLMPLGELQGRHLLTIEGLNLPGEQLNPVQLAMVDRGGSQCGFCTPGFIVSMCWYMMQGPDEAPSVEGFSHAISGNLCRCTGYGSIRRACDDLTARLGEGDLSDVWAAPDRVTALAERGLLPGYLTGIAARLAEIEAPAPAEPGDTHFIIAGGTDLYVQRGEEIPLAEVELLNRRDDLKHIEVNGDTMRVGGRVSFEAFASDPRVQAMIPSIKQDMALIASLPIRNRATIAGNLINASPIGDMTALMLALGATVELRARDGASRDLALEDLYLGYKTLAREPDEVVAELRFEVVGARDHVSFEKVSKRRWLDIATVNSAARVRLSEAGDSVESARLTLGGVAAVPLYLREASAWLAGKPLTSETARGAVEVALGEISPISDVRGSAAYKRLLARQLLLAHFAKLFPDRVDLAALDERFANATEEARR